MLKSIITFVGLISIVGILNIANTAIPNDKIQGLVARSNLYHLQFPQEKIYLHLDRPSYWANDDIWFKAYVKN